MVKRAVGRKIDWTQQREQLTNSMTGQPIEKLPMFMTVQPREQLTICMTG
jgi:hypothetical protein